MKTTSALIFSVLILTSCYETRERFGGSSTTPISTGDVFEETCESVENGQVQITGQVFSPAVETIQRYDVVKWQNNETQTHTVTAGITSARSDIFDITLSPGQQRCLRFLRTGRYDYFSQSRLDMRGQIIVE